MEFGTVPIDLSLIEDVFRLVELRKNGIKNNPESGLKELTPGEALDLILSSRNQKSFSPM